jgi:soluble lytic murein transglycosylase
MKLIKLRIRKNPILFRWAIPAKKPYYQIIIVILMQFMLFPLFIQDQEPLEKIHQQMISFYDISDYYEVFNLLAQVKHNLPQLYQLNNYAYLEGTIHQKLENYEQALESYKYIIENESILTEYAEFHLAEIYEKIGDRNEQQKHLIKIINSYPHSTLLSESLFKLAELYRQEKKLNQALTFYNLLYSKGRASYKYNALFSAGKIYRELNILDKALQKFYAVLRINTLSDIALHAAREIEEIERKMERRKIADYMLWLRFRVYFRNREFSDAVRYGKTLLAKFPQSQWSDDTYYYMALAYLRQDDINKARKYFEYLIEKFPKSSLNPACLYQLGTLKLLEEDDTAALNLFSKAFQQYPQSRWAKASLMKMIVCYFQKGEITKGQELVDSMIKKYPDSSSLANTLLQASKICWEKGEMTLSLNYLEHLYQGDFGLSNKIEALYWKGKLHQKLGQYEQALENYREIIILKPNDYFSFRAQQQISSNTALKRLINAESIFNEAEKALQEGEIAKAKNLFVQSFYLAPDELIKQKSSIMLSHCYSQLEGYINLNKLNTISPRELIQEQSEEKQPSKAGDELFFLHIYDEAVAEFEKEKKDIEHLYFLSLLCQKAMLYSKSIRYAEQIGLNLPSDYCFAALNENLKALLYPIYYYNQIQEYAQLRGIDELLLAAVIREESRFDHRAKSSASARGLMQFIPSTAKYISRSLGIKRFELEDLYRPEFSINIGSKYLQKLLRDFHGNYIAALAAYNAGAQNVRRWLKACKENDPDQLTLEITYGETREYVKRVMCSYWKYILIFPSNSLKPNNWSMQFPINSSSTSDQYRN